MSPSDRYLRDRLFDEGFALLNRGDYNRGIEGLRLASGAEHLAALRPGEQYDPASGISMTAPIRWAAQGKLGRDGQYDPSANAVDPSALVFLGAESEFKGFIERRTGESPDYRLSGYANHLGWAIKFYRQAEALRYPAASERLESLQLRLGSEDFRRAEQSFNDSRDRWDEHASARIVEMLGASRRAAPALTRVEVISTRQSPQYFNPTMKLFWDGRQVGKMSSNGGRFEFEIQSDGELLLKSPWASMRWPVTSGGSPRVYFGWDFHTRELVVSEEEIPERYLRERNR